MAKYLVLKRMRIEDGEAVRDVYPPEIIEDPDRPDILVDRGFIQALDPVEAATVGQAAAASADAEAAKPEDTVESLKADYNREELNALAESEGIEEPETYPNKAELAQAILDGRAEEEDEEEGDGQEG